MPAKTNPPAFDKNHFTLPTVGNIIASLIPSSFVMVTFFKPDLIPASFGIVRTASFYLAENYSNVMAVGGYGIPILHLFESLYAAKLCSDAGMTTSATIKWMISTMILGFWSFKKLSPYVKNAKKSQS